jgi:hypothetical protein
MKGQKEVTSNRHYATDGELALLDASTTDKDSTKRVLEGIGSRLSTASGSGSGTPSRDHIEETRRLAPTAPPPADTVRRRGVRR